MECGIIIIWWIVIVVFYIITEWNMIGRERKAHKELWNLVDGIW